MSYNYYPSQTPYAPDVNPATGLPMVDEMCVDVGGSPYGVDNYWQMWTPPAESDWQQGLDNW